MKEIGAQLFINMFDEYHKSEVAMHSFRIISVLYPTDVKMQKKNAINAKGKFPHLNSFLTCNFIPEGTENFPLPFCYEGIIFMKNGSL